MVGIVGTLRLAVVIIISKVTETVPLPLADCYYCHYAIVCIKQISKYNR